MSLKQRITDDMKSAMRAGEKRRLAVIRLIQAAIKQREVDERIEALDDAQVIAVLDKMVKQRRESLEQYEKAGRSDLAEQESYELQVLQGYLPEGLSEAEIDELIEAAIREAGAGSIKDMGKIMRLLKARAQGRADMGAVSAKVRARLGG